MVKLTEYAPAAQYVERLNQLLGLPATIPTFTRGRKKRRVTWYVFRRRKSRLWRDLEAAAAEIARREGVNVFAPSGRAFVQQLVAQMKRGYFNPTYWVECPPLITELLECVPTAEPRDPPPNSPYRDPANLPTTPTYPDGTLDAPSIAYTGATAGGYFADTYWSWGRTKYRLATRITTQQFEPLLLDWRPTITITADKRPSRPMVSTLARSYLGAEFFIDFLTRRPPLTRTISFYHRYKPPDTDPPYFNATVQRQLYAVLNARSTYQDAAPITHAAILWANRPMKGLAYNNNTTVQTSLSGTPKLFMLRPPPVIASAPLGYDSGATFWLYDIITNEWAGYFVEAFSVAWATHGDTLCAYSLFELLQFYGPDQIPTNTLPQPWAAPYEYDHLAASPWGYTVVATNPGPPKTSHAWLYAPDGTLLSDLELSDYSIDTGGLYLHRGYTPDGALFGPYPVGALNEILLWLPSYAFAGAITTRPGATPIMLPGPNGIWSVTPDNVANHSAWPTGLQQRTYPYNLASTTTPAAQLPAYAGIAGLDDGLFCWEPNGANFLLLPDGTIVPGNPMTQVYPGVNAAAHVHI